MWVSLQHDFDFCVWTGIHGVAFIWCFSSLISHSKPIHTHIHSVLNVQYTLQIRTDTLVQVCTPRTHCNYQSKSNMYCSKMHSHCVIVWVCGLSQLTGIEWWIMDCGYSGFFQLWPWLGYGWCKVTFVRREEENCIEMTGWHYPPTALALHYVLCAVYYSNPLDSSACLSELGNSRADCFR